IRDGDQIRLRIADRDSRGTIRPISSQDHSQTSIRHTEAEIMTHPKAGAINMQIGISKIDVPRRLQQDLLDIPVGQVWIRCQDQSYHSADLWGGSRGAAKSSL